VVGRQVDWESGLVEASDVYMDGVGDSEPKRLSGELREKEMGSDG
jgi:hypothetical protein